MANGDPVINVSELINLLTGGSGGAPEQINVVKVARVGSAAAAVPTLGSLTSLFMYEGVPSGSGTVSAGTVVTNATPGTLRQTSPASGKKKRISGATFSANAQGSLLILDRLSYDSGHLATGATAQTYTGGAPTRYTGGVGVMAFAEVYSTLGATATTITASYTNDQGVAGKTSIAAAFGGTGRQNQGVMLPLTLASGDRGVRSVQTFTAAATTGAGAYGITLAYPLFEIPLPLTGVSGLFNAILTVGGPIDTNGGGAGDAGLMLAWRAGIATAPELQGNVYFFEK